MGAQNPGFLSALFGGKFPYNRANFGGSPRAERPTKIQDLGDTEIWRELARLSDVRNFRTDPTLHARIPRMTYVQATPSNYY